jgi:membrane-associated phospholipid phosphatase
LASDPQPAPLPPAVQVTRFWSANRRLMLLVSLAISLALVFVWLPGGARSGLLVALQAQSALVGLLFLLALVGTSLMWSAGQRLDARIFLYINLRGFHSRWMDRFMWLATQAGNVVVALALAGLFAALNYRRLAVEVILGTLALWLLVETIKALTDRSRPFRALEQTRIIGWRERGRSFPSGHTAQTFFLVTLLVHQFQLGIVAAMVLYAFAGLVGLTRVYVGAHYPRDVIAGAVLGSVWGVLAAMVDPYWFGFHF